MIDHIGANDWIGDRQVWSVLIVSCRRWFPLATSFTIKVYLLCSCTVLEYLFVITIHLSVHCYCTCALWSLLQFWEYLQWLYHSSGTPMANMMPFLITVNLSACSDRCPEHVQSYDSAEVKFESHSSDGIMWIRFVSLEHAFLAHRFKKISLLSPSIG